MKRTNKYLDNLVTKIINETLEEKADQVMAKLGGSDDFDYVAEGETCECGSKEFYEKFDNQLSLDTPKQQDFARDFLYDWYCKTIIGEKVNEFFSQLVKTDFKKK